MVIILVIIIGIPCYLMPYVFLVSTTKGSPLLMNSIKEVYESLLSVAIP